MYVCGRGIFIGSGTPPSLNYTNVAEFNYYRKLYMYCVLTKWFFLYDSEYQLVSPKRIKTTLRNVGGGFQYIVSSSVKRRRDGALYLQSSKSWAFIGRVDTKSAGWHQFTYILVFVYLEALLRNTLMRKTYGTLPIYIAHFLDDLLCSRASESTKTTVLFLKARRWVILTGGEIIHPSGISLFELCLVKAIELYNQAVVCIDVPCNAFFK